MAENKTGSVTFRTQSALKKSFEDAMEKQNQFGSATGFFEDCMRAMILAVRQKKDLDIPLEFREREKPD